MSDLPEFEIGEKLQGFPGRRMKQLVAAVSEALQESGDWREAWISRSQTLLSPHQQTVKVISNHAGILEPFSVLGFDGLPDGVADLDEAVERSRAMLLEGGTPAASHGQRMLVLQDGAEQGDVVEACFGGLTLARVNVTDMDHTHAGLAAGDATRLASGTAGAEIWWSETASTGEQWCLVMLGGSGAAGDLPHAIAASSSGCTSEDISAAVTGVYCYLGTDPPASDPATAANVDGHTVDAGGDFLMVSGDFPAWQASTPYAEGDMVTYDNGGGLRRWSKIADGSSGAAFTPALWTNEEAATGWKIAYVFSSGDVNTYNVKLQAAKSLADDLVSVRFLNAALDTQVGDAFDAHDPHNRFSSGKVTDAIGRVTLVKDADSGATRFELTHLQQLSNLIYGTLGENAGASVVGAAGSSSYSPLGDGWASVSPTGTIRITGLDQEFAGDAYVAKLENPDSTPIRYRATKVPSGRFTFNVKLQAAKTKSAPSVYVKLLQSDLATESGDAFLAYDPHQKFSSGKHDDSIGRATLVTNPNGGGMRFELTHLAQLVRVIYGTLGADASGGSASSSSYSPQPQGWDSVSPAGTVSIVGLTDEKSGDAFVATLEDPDAATITYRAVMTPHKIPKYGKIGKTTSEISARSGSTPGSGSVSAYVRDASGGTLGVASGEGGVWFNLADETIDDDKWVMGLPVPNSEGVVEWWIVWEQC